MVALLIIREWGYVHAPPLEVLRRIGVVGGIIILAAIVCGAVTLIRFPWER
jgi:hypothetical protein